MGDNPQPNRPLTVDEMKCIQVLLEDNWIALSDKGEVNVRLTMATGSWEAYVGKRFSSWN
jgi:hypothetical protein